MNHIEEDRGRKTMKNPKNNGKRCECGGLLSSVKLQLFPGNISIKNAQLVVRMHSPAFLISPTKHKMIGKSIFSTSNCEQRTIKVICKKCGKEILLKDKLTWLNGIQVKSSVGFCLKI